MPGAPDEGALLDIVKLGRPGFLKSAKQPKLADRVGTRTVYQSRRRVSAETMFLCGLWTSIFDNQWLYFHHAKMHKHYEVQFDFLASAPASRCLFAQTLSENEKSLVSNNHSRKEKLLLSKYHSRPETLLACIQQPLQNGNAARIRHDPSIGRIHRDDTTIVRDTDSQNWPQDCGRTCVKAGRPLTCAREQHGAINHETRSPNVLHFVAHDLGGSLKRLRIWVRQ